MAAWKADEPEMEYQIAHALRERGHEIHLLGVRDDLQYPFISYGHDMANAAAKVGMKYSDFIQRIVDAAIARYERS